MAPAPAARAASGRSWRSVRQCAWPLLAVAAGGGWPLVCRAAELTHADWDLLTADKTVLMNFFSPNCGHCKKLEPAWKRLSEEYDGSIFAGVFEVNCAGSGKVLCSEFKIKGTPSILYGNTSVGRDPTLYPQYVGEKGRGHLGHTYESLTSFASRKLGLPCTPIDLGGCREEERQLFETLRQVPLAEIEVRMRDLQTTFRDKEKQLYRKRRKCEEEQDVFDKDLQEFRLEKNLFTKADKALEKKGSRATAKEKQKHEAKRTIMQQKSEALEQRRVLLLQDRDDCTKERWALNGMIRSSGFGMMKLMQEMRHEEKNATPEVQYSRPPGIQLNLISEL